MQEIREAMKDTVAAELLGMMRHGLDNEKVLEELKNTKVVREGSKIIIPPHVPMKVAIEAMKRHMDSEEKVQELSFDFHLTLPEGALALFKTLEDQYGFVSHMGQPGFFGSSPPQILTIQVDKNKTQMVPWGNFKIPGLDGTLTTDICWTNGIPFFRLEAAIPGKEIEKVHRIVDAIKARHDSIYKGRSVKVRFPALSEKPQITDFFPQFMDVQDLTREDLIFSDDIEEVLNDSLFTPIEFTQHCRDNNVPLKIGVLLEGPYGVGKTLTASVTAKMAEANGWTFIHMLDVRDLPRVYAFAAHHQPAVIFCEDLDQILKESKTRDAMINDILNSIDGIEAKGVEILTVLTTNHVGLVTKAMLRPGRLDAVVSMRAPDTKAVQRLVRLFAGDKLPQSEDLTTVGEILKGRNAAIVREVVERSKRSAIRRLTYKGQPITLLARDIEIAAMGMEAHIKLLEPAPVDSRSDIEKAAGVVAEAFSTTLTKFLPEHSSPSNGHQLTPSKVGTSWVNTLPAAADENTPPA